MTARCADRPRPCRSRAGFTLTELTVAAALGSALLAVLLGLGLFHGRPAARTHDRLANLAAARAVVARLGPDLALARALPLVGDDGRTLRIPIRPRDQDQQVVYRADPLRGVTRSVRTVPGGAVVEREVRLLLEAPVDLRFGAPAGGDGFGLELTARSRPPRPGEEPDARDEVRLAVAVPGRALDESRHVSFWTPPAP